jgi:hypothetical protein
MGEVHEHDFAHSRPPPILYENQGDTANSGRSIVRAPSILVEDLHPRTTAPHGLSHLEMDWVTEGVRYLRRQGPAAFMTVEGYDRSEREKRTLFRKVKNDVALYQGREKMRRVLWLEVLESEPDLHSHIVATMPSEEAVMRLAERMHMSASYGQNVLVQPVTDWDGLTTYLLKEATPQAWAKGGKSFRRVSGSHPLAEGGGDRVRTSKDLEAALIRSGRVEPRRRTYAARSLPKPPALPKPVEVAPTVNAVQLPLFGALPERRYLQPADLRSFRQVRGYSQSEVSKWAGIRNRSHIANYERGHDGLSLHRQRLLKHMMDAQKVAA